MITIMIIVTIISSTREGRAVPKPARTTMEPKVLKRIVLRCASRGGRVICVCALCVCVYIYIYVDM